MVAPMGTITRPARPHDMVMAGLAPIRGRWAAIGSAGWLARSTCAQGGQRKGGQSSRRSPGAGGRPQRPLGARPKTGGQWRQ